MRIVVVVSSVVVVVVGAATTVAPVVGVKPVVGDHAKLTYPDPAAVKETEPPSQNVVAPAGVIPRAGGAVTVTVTSVRVALSQPAAEISET